jgi:HlyD family secretion protein
MKKNYILIFAVLILFSCDSDKIAPGISKDNTQTTILKPDNIVKVEQKQVSNVYEAVGTIRPLTESVIESQISAQVLKVSCVPGAEVKKGQILIKLDSRRLTTQLQQAKEGLSVARNNLKQTYKSINEAQAGMEQAAAAYNRTKKLFKKDIVPSQKLEIDKAGFLQAKARLEKAQEAEHAAKASIRQSQEIVNEANIGFGYSNIKSPAAGIVAQRLIDPGDLAVPGKPLLIVQTSGALRLEANVREGLIGKIILGSEHEVKIKTIGKSLVSVIEEIIPYADPDTRTFIVKAALPKTPGVYPGMFGRLLIPVGTDKTLLIPKNAVSYVGQLELVNVQKNDQWQRVYIKTGRIFGEKIEVLSGISINETIGY